MNHIVSGATRLNGGHLKRLHHGTVRFLQLSKNSRWAVHETQHDWYGDSG